MRTDLCFILATLIVGACASATVGTSPDPIAPLSYQTELEGMKRTVAQLKKMVAADDKAAVAALIHFPIIYRSTESVLEIESEAKFIERYDDLITSRVEAALICSDLEKLDYSPTFGTIVGEREIVLARFANGLPNPVYRVIALRSSPWPAGQSRSDQDCFREMARTIEARKKQS